MRGFNELKETLHNNRVNWILDVARQEMGLSNSHDLSIQELCWWAFMRNMMHLMPEEVCRISINKMKATPQDSGPLKEADIRPYDDRATAYVQMMEERAAPMRAKVCPVDVDSDPYGAFQNTKTSIAKIARVHGLCGFPSMLWLWSCGSWRSHYALYRSS